MNSLQHLKVKSVGISKDFYITNEEEGGNFSWISYYTLSILKCYILRRH